MLAQRVAPAVVGVPLILGLIVWGGPAYSLAVAAVLVVAALEFFAAADPQGPPPTTTIEARRLLVRPPLALLAARGGRRSGPPGQHPVHGSPGILFRDMGHPVAGHSAPRSPLVGAISCLPR